MVEWYWTEHEWDFANLLNIRAMDWFEHKRDWREFFRLKQRFGQGSATHTAYANDPEIAAETADWMRKNKDKRTEINPEGFDAVMHKLCDLEDRLSAVAASFGGGDVTPTRRPVYLAQKLKTEKSRSNTRKRIAQLVPDDVEES